MPWLLANWRLIAIGLAVTAVFAAGWKLRDYQAIADISRAQEAYRVALEETLAERKEIEDRLLAESKDLETRLAAVRKKNRQAQRERNREFAKSAYNCVIPADGVRIISDAITEANASRAAR